MKQLILILLFATPAFAQIDYSAKLDDQTPFRRMFDAPTIAEKKMIWTTLSREEQDTARIENILWGVRTLGMTEREAAYSVRFIAGMRYRTDEDRDQFRDEAEQIFAADTKHLLFGSIGPYIKLPCSGSVKVSFMLMGNCPCSIGSSVNMACNNDCSSPGNSCTQTSDGCGFAWWYPCNGTCDTGGVHWNDLTGRVVGTYRDAGGVPINDLRRS